jgi:hypothetical protein
LLHLLLLQLPLLYHSLLRYPIWRRLLLIIEYLLLLLRNLRNCLSLIMHHLSSRRNWLRNWLNLLLLLRRFCSIYLKIRDLFGTLKSMLRWISLLRLRLLSSIASFLNWLLSLDRLRWSSWNLDFITTCLNGRWDLSIWLSLGLICRIILSAHFNFKLIIIKLKLIWLLMRVFTIQGNRQWSSWLILTYYLNDIAIGLTWVHFDRDD